MIRKAEQKDTDKIEALYDRIHDEEEAGRVSIGWIRGVYPVRQTAADAVCRGDMFVEEDGQEMVACGVINQQQMPAYARCHWEFEAPDEKVMVLHTLVVNPDKNGRGYGSTFVRFYEQYAMEHGCQYLRMDTNEKNTIARKMYRKRGYREAGIVTGVFNGIPDVHLVCLEKNMLHPF